MVVHLLRRDGSLFNSHILGKGRCLWLEWDCKVPTDSPALLARSLMPTDSPARHCLAAN